MNQELPNEFDWRFVAVLNEKIPVGKLMNALGHMTAGLAGGFGRGHEMHFLEYKDASGGIHPHISHFPFIVVKAENSNQVAKVRAAAIEQNFMFTDFTSTMTVGTSQEQQDRTAQTKLEELEYFGICLFGETEKLKPLTKKFSLFNI